MKGLVFLPLPPANIEEMKQRITAALETVSKDMLQRVWLKLEYRLDVSRVTGGSHIEHSRKSVIEPTIVLFFVNLTTKTYDLQHKMYLVSLRSIK